MKILFMGDANFSRLEKPLNKENARYLLSDVKPYADNADYRIVNMEEPMGDKNKYEPISKSGPNLISSAQNICFYEELKTDIAVLANNHIGDYGVQAAKDTMELIKAHNMKYIGAGKNIEDAYNAEILEKDGVKVSVIAVCENEFGIAEKDKAGSAGFNALRLCNRIKEEKQKADYVVVVFHGGDEKNPLPAPKCAERYRLIIELGADAIIAMHTHCPQGYEYYKGKPIVYSMGNFIFQSGSEDMNINDPWFYGYMTMLDVSKDGVEISEIIPYRFNNPATKITVFEGEDKQKMLDYIKEISDMIQDEELMYKHYIGWMSERLQWRYVGDPRETTDQQKLNAYKNIFGCEAHNAIMSEGYKLHMEHKIEYAKSLYPDACKRSEMPVKW